jgi:hypothetical protein
MTLEEAQSLKPGDVVTGTWYISDRCPEFRTIVESRVKANNLLHWDDTIGAKNAYPYANMTIVSRADAVVTNTYSIW